MIAAAPSSKPPASVARHILIVDDEVDIVFPLKQALSQCGFRVTQALDGNEGLAVIEFDPPDLVILDIKMPHRGGLMVLEHLRERLEFTGPIIMLTAIDGHRHFQYAKTLGVADFLRKPFSLKRLIDRVTQLVGELP